MAPAPAPSPSPGGGSAVTDETLASGSTGSANVPSGLMATVADTVADEYDSGDEYQWDGDESGYDFTPGAARNSNNDVPVYPSCNHVVVKTNCPSLRPSSSALPLAPSVSSSQSIILPLDLSTLIATMSKASILPGSGQCFTVADSGATHHMFPDKVAFISYKTMTNLQVRMGNNSFLPVLGCGSAVISLNGQKILVQNALHVPGLVVPLYSLRAHCTQRGCGFIGTSDIRILVYFPTFVLSVDMSKDCHLTFDSLGRSAPIDSLDYVQPRCSLTLYPAELFSTTVAKTSPAPNIVEDDCSTSPNAILAPSSPVPSLPPPLVPSSSDSSADDLSRISARLQSLADAILSLQA